MEGPEDLAILGVQGQDPTVCTADIGTTRPDDDLAVGEDRAGREPFTELDGTHLGAPQLFTGVDVEGDDPTVSYGVVDLAIIDDHATAGPVFNEAGVLVEFGNVGPDRVTVARVYCHHPIGAVNVHDAVVDGGGEPGRTLVIGVDGPGEPEVRHVIAVDLIQRAVAGHLQVAAIGRPVTGRRIGKLLNALCNASRQNQGRQQCEH